MTTLDTRAGLRFERFHTQPGTHPYLDIDWERRDAIVADHGTGETVFSQVGIRVPTFWSDHALNIAAQKYFRFALNDPRRETGVDDMIDRVTNTITEWGRKDGYFADDGSAQVFSSELRYLLVHQMASFNSPVWFNVGVPGRNPQCSACQPWDALVVTPQGLVPIGQLVEQNAIGTKVYDHDGLTKIVAVKANGQKPVLRVRLKSGTHLDVTPDHLVWSNGRFVEAAGLKSGDQLMWCRTHSEDEGGFSYQDVAEAVLAGWLQTDGFVGQYTQGTNRSLTVEAITVNDGERAWITSALDECFGDVHRHESHPFKYFEIDRVEELGIQEVFDIQTESGEYLSAGFRVHNCFILSVDDTLDSILNWYTEEGIIFKGGSGSGVNLSRLRANGEALAGGGTASGPVSFMRGADASAGTIKSGGTTRRAAKLVCLDVDHPDVEAFIWCKAREEERLAVLAAGGVDVSLNSSAYTHAQYQNANNSVRLTDEFMLAVEAGDDWSLVARTTGEIVRTVHARDLFRQIAQAAWQCADPGVMFDTTINAWHTTPNAGRITSSNPCGEYNHLDNSACNLASLNLLAFDSPDGFDIPGFVHAVEIMLTAQDILVDNSSYPTPKIAKTARAYRQLGLGYANLGALLMRNGLPYDSPQGRAMAASITALMTGVAYRQSAEIARKLGPFEGFQADRDNMLGILAKHTAALDDMDTDLAPTMIRGEAIRAWADALKLAGEHGVRNAQASLLAPTGTIAFLMDCATTGVEPALALIMIKFLAGGGTMRIVNDTVDDALRTLGYSPAEIEQIATHVTEHGSVLGCPSLNPAHVPVFATAMGDNSIAPMGHVDMMAAVQPFLSGAISKSVNCPAGTTVDQIEDLYMQAWRKGVKCLAVYRDGCKAVQPVKVHGAAATEDQAAQRGVVRRHLPAQRDGWTRSFRVGDAEGYLTVGRYPGDGLGEIFLKVSKQGSTLAGLFDAFAIAVSIGLQYGVPLETFVRKFTGMRFEPAGMTDDEDVRMATSIPDYLFRILALEFLPADAREALGILSIRERVDRLDDLELSDQTADAPLCYTCGVAMVRAGTCHTCPQCGSTSGCS